MSILGKRIRYLREKKNYSQKHVADALGITNVQLSRYESGDRKPDPDTIVAIAKFFNVPTDYIHGLSDNPEPFSKVTVAGQEISLTADELKLFNELKKHPIMFNDLASDPEKKIKELLKLYKMKKMFLEDEDEEYGDGFGDLED